MKIRILNYLKYRKKGNLRNNLKGSYRNQKKMMSIREIDNFKMLIKYKIMIRIDKIYLI